MIDSASFNFGAWLKRLRKQLGYSRQQVSDNANGTISQQYVHFIEIGKATNIGSDKLKALSAGLKVPLEILQTALYEQREPVFPIIGRAAAGQAVASLSEGYYPEVDDRLPYCIPQRGLFAVEILGDSMSPVLSHGDVALVKPLRNFQPSQVISGAIYLLGQEGKQTCKYLVSSTEDVEKIWIMAEQENLFATTLLEESYRIIGQVIEVRKTSSLIKPSLR